MDTYPVKKDDISIVLCGAAGQGIQTVEQLLTHLFKQSGYNLYSTKEYMSRVRGGSNSTELRVGSHKIRAFVDRIDILFPLSRASLAHVEKRISQETIIIGEKNKLSGGDEEAPYNIIDIPFSEIAREIGGAIYSNIIAVGVVAALFNIENGSIEEFLKIRFAKKGEDIIAKNIEAAARGYDIGRELSGSGKVTIEITRDPRVEDEIIISGGEAVAMGAIAGGCNFISSYPMTPSTPVLTFLSQNAADYHIIAEQAEDEIAAINMAIGAWYAGSRAMVTTSGGGFALMTEGVSLAGIIESPIVVHLAQRPGPATGLPTRTEQADLELVLYAGHGEFPRIIFAPGTLEQAFSLTQHSFNLADRYQIPVFVLTDQYFIDSYYNTPRIDVSGYKIEKHIVRTSAEYKRYTLTDNGISPRGIPGHGDGLIVVDSDEHDEAGHITEDHDIRIQMMDKRLKKLSSMKEVAVTPELAGDADYDTLIICWGSTYTIVREAVHMLGRDDVAVLHFSQVYPLPTEITRYFEKAKRRVIVENNATSQFGKLLEMYGGFDIDDKILKYNGLAFSVEELAEKLLAVIT